MKNDDKCDSCDEHFTRVRNPRSDAHPIFCVKCAAAIESYAEEFGLTFTNAAVRSNASRRSWATGVNAGRSTKIDHDVPDRDYHGDRTRDDT